MSIDLENMTKEDIIRLLQMHAKNWLAHDGCWFLAIEESEGIEKAMEYDAASWRRFSRIEAKRIKKEFNLPENGGLQALEKALFLRLYATINRQETEWKNEKTLIFRMVDCRVQSARQRKKLPDFPCKPVGLVEYAGFASEIDPSIKTKCIACPPDEHPVEYHCAWEFTVE